MKRAARNRTGKDQVTAPVMPAVTHTIDLSPGDWMRATWRPRQPLVKPAFEPRPFNLDAAFKQLAQISVGQYGGRIWGSSRMPAYRSREEAHFWLWAATQPVEGYQQKKTIKPLS